MGELNFLKNKFYFSANSKAEKFLAEKAGMKFDADTLQWVTRSAEKARTLRQYANQSAEQKLKNTFITELALPEQIIYPDQKCVKTWQMESAWHCVSRTPAYCADEAGLGKTITAILCMNTVRGKSLIICPSYLKYNWLDELVEWSTHLTKNDISLIESGDAGPSAYEAQAVILSDALLTNEKVKLILRGHRFMWGITDEFHRYKEATTKRTVALLGDESHAGFLSEIAERIITLSGTPIPNGRPIELYAALSQLAPEAIGHRTLLEYGKTFCAGKQITRYEGKRAVVNWDFMGASNLKQLRRELRAKFMIRHLKKDVLKELGPKTRRMIFLDEPKELHKFGQKVLHNHSLEDLMGEDSELGDIATYRREVGESKVIPAFTYILDLLENEPGKVVVFARHIAVVERLTELLFEFNPVMIRGGITAKEKAKRVKKFQSDDTCRVVIGNLDAMGVGNTLTRASRMVMVEWEWTPGVNEQAEDRIHRLTQTGHVLIDYLVHRESLDERMLRSSINKDKNIALVMS